MAVSPSDSGKSVTRSVVIYCHFCSSSGIGCSTHAFFLWSDFTNWQTGQVRTYSPTVLHIPRHQKALLMWSTVLLSPTCPIDGTLWVFPNDLLLHDLGHHHQPSITLNTVQNPLRGYSDFFPLQLLFALAEHLLQLLVSLLGFLDVL